MPARNPPLLAPGDPVEVDGHRATVGRTYRFEDHRSRWSEHALIDGAWRRWLTIDPEGETVLWERVGPVAGPPEAPEIQQDALWLGLQERGTATYELLDPGEDALRGSVQYVDYAAGTRRVSFERYDVAGSWEVSAGTVLPADAVRRVPR